MILTGCHLDDAKKLDDLIKIATIVNVYGIKGAIKLKIHLDDQGLFSLFDQILDEKNAPVSITLLRKINNFWLAQIDGVCNRSDAEKYKDKALFVSRAAFPPLGEEEYYFSDLLDFEVRDLNGQVFGVVSCFYDLSEKYIVEVRVSKNQFYNFEFLKSVVPEINTHNKYIIVDISQKIDMV